MNRKDLFGRIVQAAELGCEPVPGKTVVEILGADSVLIENHRGVFSYSLDKVCVKSAQGTVAVSGRKLVLSKLSKEILLICGCIEQVSLIGGTGK